MSDSIRNELAIFFDNGWLIRKCCPKDFLALNIEVFIGGKGTYNVVFVVIGSKTQHNYNEVI